MCFSLRWCNSSKNYGRKNDHCIAMEAHVQNWVLQNQGKLDKISARITDIEHESLTCSIPGLCSVTFLVPSDKYSSIMVLSGDDETSASFNQILSFLNDKLERLGRRKPDCLSRALDMTLQALTQYCYRASVDEWAKNLPSSSVCILAIDARKKCREILFMENLELDDYDHVLAWCDVSVNERRQAVILELDARGIFYDYEHVARGLGFPLDGSNFTIDVVFNEDEWFARSSIHARDCEYSDIVGTIPLTEEEKKPEFGRRILYGPNVLVPKIVKEFFQSQSRKGTDEMDMEFAANENVFVSIIKFVWERLEKIKISCVCCHKELPAECRLWYCDATLCMYKFEEFSTGASVLQELQNTEIVVFEIACARAAAMSEINRDCFEPFPTYLLRECEIRDRSGFFSQQGQELRKQSSKTSFQNKNLKLLELIVQSFPPISVMQTCKGDQMLKHILTSSFNTKIEELRKNRKLSLDELPNNHEQLPYNVLKFILFTNRNLLRPLGIEQQLKLKNISKQFVIIYDSEKEALFSRKREAYGSIFAFHGSGRSNWFSIVRNGLKSCSNTAYMSRGAAHGAGIYLAMNINKSLSYCSYRLELEKDKSYCVVALCEIFNGKSHSKDNGMLVVPAEHESNVVIRYLLLCESSVGDISIKDRILTGTSQSYRVDLLSHYEQQRIQFLQENANQNMLRRNEIMALLEKRRINLLKTCKD